MKISFKNTANKITLVRILLIPFLCLLVIFNKKKLFAIVFSISGITDFLDGYIARKWNEVSEFGAALDSFADNMILSFTPFWFWSLLPNFVSQHYVIIIILFLMFSVSILLGYIKYKTMIDYHLYLNKTAAILFYIFCVHALLFKPNDIFFYFTILIGTLGCIEEILITLTKKTMQRDRLSIFRKNFK